MLHVEVDRRAEPACLKGDGLKAFHDVRDTGLRIGGLDAGTKSGYLDRDVDQRWLRCGQWSLHFPRAGAFGEKIEELPVFNRKFVCFPIADDRFAQDIHGKANALSPVPAKVGK